MLVSRQFENPSEVNKALLELRDIIDKAQYLSCRKALGGGR